MTRGWCGPAAALAILVGCQTWGGRATCRAADPGVEPTAAEERAFVAAVEGVAAAVVRIDPQPSLESGRAAEAGPGTGPSTGVIVGRHGADAAAAWIVTTSFAVPADAAQAVVQAADGTRAVGRVVGRDSSRGLVLVSAGPLPPAPEIAPAPRGDLRTGQWTIAVGRGWGGTGVSVGVLSATNRAWGRAVQTDASVSPMNYGGPLLDIRGRVIGIVAPFPAELAGLPLGTELYDSGIGFAVPLEDVLRVLPRMQAGETLARGILGIGYRSADQINGVPVIGGCRQGSPAAAAGLRPGDRIVAVDGGRTDRIADVRERIAPKYAGDAIEIVVERPPAARPASSAPEPAPRLTVRTTLVAELPPRRRGVIGVLPVPPRRPTTPDAGGADPVVVAAVVPDGPAARAGLVAGDVIDWLAPVADDAAAAAPPPAEARVAVDSPAAVAGVLAATEPGTRLALGYTRSGTPAVVRVVTAAPPDDLPPLVPATGAGPLALPDVDIVPLAAAEVADPPLAVIPRSTAAARAGGPRAGGVLVYCGPPHGPATRADATAWSAAVAAHGVAVILPGSGDPRRWSADDLPGIRRALVTLDARFPVDPARIAVAGTGAGGTFAWLAAERLGSAVGGVALVDAVLPRRAVIEPDETGRSRWVLLGGADAARGERLAADRRRLQAAGIAVGTLEVGPEGPPTDLLCRWVAALGLL